MTKAVIRQEQPGDEAAISHVIASAFRVAERSSGIEAQVVDRLRVSNALTTSLVATIDNNIVGHIAFSFVAIASPNGVACEGWHGLGPIAVDPELHGDGIGSALVEQGLDAIRLLGAAGCVVLGNPRFYSRFGFRTNPAVILPGVAKEYFQIFAFSDAIPVGTVTYHAAFS